MTRVATKRKWPPCWTYYSLNTYLCWNMDFSLYKGYLLLPNNVKAGWTPTVHYKHQQGTKLVSGKITICSYSSFYSHSSCKKNFILHNSVLIVDTTVYLTRIDCAYLLVRHRIYKSMEWQIFPLINFWTYTCTYSTLDLHFFTANHIPMHSIQYIVHIVTWFADALWIWPSASMSIKYI